jgi:hypothetical protein
MRGRSGAARGARTMRGGVRIATALSALFVVTRVHAGAMEDPPPSPSEPEQEQEQEQEPEQEEPAPPTPGPPPAPELAAAPTADAARTPPPCPSCCMVAAELGPRFGLTVNADQWLFGAALRSSVPCLGNLGVGPALAVGVGGNHLTMRSSGRLDYMLWLDHAHTFGVYPAVGASVRFYVPVGRFASFCNRVHLDECSGYDVGGEIGGGVRYRWLALDAFAGSRGLPVVTVMAALSFPLVGPELP